MSKKKQETTKYKKEEQVIGWSVIVVFDRKTTSPYGYTYDMQECIDADSWEQAGKIARDIAAGAYPKVSEGKPAIYIRRTEEVLYAKTIPRTRTIYIKK